MNFFPTFVLSYSWLPNICSVESYFTTFVTHASCFRQILFSTTFRTILLVAERLLPSNPIFPLLSYFHTWLPICFRQIYFPTFVPALLIRTRFVSSNPVTLLPVTHDSTTISLRYA
jgi:hypothetical protein